MRTRLRAILMTLMAGAIVALAVPLASAVVDIHQHRMLTDRVSDARRFTALAQQAVSPSDEESLRVQLRRYGHVYRISSAVFDRNGEAVFASSTPEAPVDGGVDRYVAAALSGRATATTTRIWPWDVEPLIVAEPVVREGDVVGALLTMSPTTRLRGLVAALLAIVGVAVLIAVGGAVVVASKVAEWVLLPIRRLDAAVRMIGVGDLSARVTRGAGPPELRELACSFNRMAAHVEASIGRQRDFVANASHQLRNPLSALALRIDQLEQSAPLGQDEVYAHIRSEVRRLGNVLDELLRLARVEGSLRRPRLVDVDAVVEDRIRAWAPAARKYDIVIDKRGESPVRAWLEATLLGTALDAVLDNALKFSPQCGVVAIDVSARGGRVFLAVSDQGAGLPSDELHRITDRFWRSARHQNIAGSGLGLSIAQSVLAPYGGGIAAQLGEDGGLVVTIMVPAASNESEGSCPGELAVAPR